MGGTKLTSTRVTVGGLIYVTNMFRKWRINVNEYFVQVRGAVLDVTAITDRLCFATIRSEEIEPASTAATAPEHQIEMIFKLRDGFLSLEQITAARGLLEEACSAATILEFEGFPERLLGVPDQHPRPVSAHHTFGSLCQAHPEPARLLDAVVPQRALAPHPHPHTSPLACPPSPRAISRRSASTACASCTTTPRPAIRPASSARAPARCAL